MMRKQNPRNLMIVTVAILFLGNVVLGILAGKSPTISWLDYLLSILDGVTDWTGKIVWAIAIIWVITHLIFRGSAPRALTPSQVGDVLAEKFPTAIQNPIVTVSAFAILVVLAPVLYFEIRQPSPYIPPGSAIAITTDDKQMFVADEKAENISVYDLAQLYSDQSGGPNRMIALRGRPTRLAIAPKKQELWVIDAEADTVNVFDLRGGAEKAVIPAGKGARWIAITPDERKAYVSNEQPISEGSITVIDLQNYKVSGVIADVSCPEGLAVTPDSKWLFVASQCGGGQDPVFVIDTADDRVTKAIPNLAVGITLAITPDGKKVYVVRGKFKQPGQAGTPAKSYPPQLSVIETTGNRIVKTLPFPYGIGAIAVTRDSRHLLIGHGTQIVILDTASDTEVTTISVGSPITAIAISGNNTAYARRGQKGDLFVVRLSGLLKTEEQGN